MKLPLNCTICLINGVSLFDDKTTVDIRDDGLYELNCELGHKSVFYLENPKYEILFQSGSLALLDGHKKEAVSSFASALERFFEFYIKVISLKYSISYDDLKKSWKDVENQSERQLGAFLFFYLLENKQPVSFLKKKIIKEGEKGSRWELSDFRNRVIHKGYIPTYDEVVQYGTHIFDNIIFTLKELKATNLDYINQLQSEILLEMKKASPTDLNTQTGKFTTMLTLSGDFKGNASFREELEILQITRRFFPM